MPERISTIAIRLDDGDIPVCVHLNKYETTIWFHGSEAAIRSFAKQITDDLEHEVRERDNPAKETHVPLLIAAEGVVGGETGSAGGEPLSVNYPTEIPF